MFKEMRRKDKAKPREDAERIFRDFPNGMLALTLDDGYPYCIPVTQVYENGNIYFHSAIAGQKYEALIKEPKVCFTVTEKDDLQPGKFTTLYSSALAFGKASLVKEESETARICDLIVKKVDPNHTSEGSEYMKASMGKFCVFKITVEHMTAKGLG